MDDLARLNLIGNSPQFRRVYEQLRKIAGVDATVLIEGETGTGKESAARAIHYLGRRCDMPFIPVNCGALPETLIESELFGHEKGAFTDAKTASPGLVAEADGGTLFLDEIDALNHKAQAAVLRFLQDRTFRRVGSGATRHADVRIVAASNANLEKLVEEGRFRRDLMYRINVLSVRMPPLRERTGDVLTMAKAFLARFSRQYRLPLKSLHADAVEFIEKYAWPGNVRELENLIHREFLMCDGAEIHFGSAAIGVSADKEGSIDGDYLDNVDLALKSFKPAKAQAILNFERRYLRDVMRRANGNMTRAAEIAQQERSAFGKLARKHGFGREGSDTVVLAAQDNT